MQPVYSHIIIRNMGHASVHLVHTLRYKPESHVFDSRWCPFLPAALWPFGVDSASNRNEYQEYFLGVKAAGA